MRPTNFRHDYNILFTVVTAPYHLIDQSAISWLATQSWELLDVEAWSRPKRLETRMESGPFFFECCGV